MPESKEQMQDAIPESTAARLAYHLAVIPILGLFFYMGLAFLALFQIGKGRTGFIWLGKGFWRMLRMTGAGVIGVVVCWFCPFKDSEIIERESYANPHYAAEEYYLEDGYSAYGQGYSMRTFDYPVKYVKVSWWTYRYKNGRKESEGYYWWDKRVSNWITWHPNGQKRIEGRYDAGKETGRHTRWNKSGQKISEGEFINGEKNGLWTEWRRDGSKLTECMYKRNMLDGKSTTWWANGCRLGEGFYKLDNREGVWTTWYMNGKKESEGEYKDDLKEGIWTIWYLGGQKMKEEEFKKGLKNGKSLLWDVAGELDTETIYRNDEYVTGRTTSVPPKSMPPPNK